MKPATAYRQELNFWVVVINGKDSNRFRFRGEAEAHAQSLRRLMPQVPIKAMFDDAVSAR